MGKGQRTELILLSRLIHKLSWRKARIPRVGEHSGSLVDRTTEPTTNSQQPRTKRRNQIFSSARGNNRVHRTVRQKAVHEGIGGSKQRRKHDTHPDTAGPWSAVNMRIISRNLVA